MSKQVKAFELETLRKSLGSVRDCVLIEPLKVDSFTDYEFRKNLRAKKVSVKLVKNTFAKKIFGENGVTLDGVWGGPTLICYGGQNIKELSTAVDEQVKASKKDPKAPDKFKVKTAVADGQAVTLDIAKTLPTREEAIGDILNALLSAGGSLVSAITSPGAELASILKTLEERTPEAEAAPPAEAAPATAG